MNSKDAIKKIMNILNLTQNKFYDARTEQGINVKMEGESLETGKTLYVATDEGMIPAPAGKHKMEDGSEIEVGEDGVVEKISMSDLDYSEDSKLEDKKEKAVIKDEAMKESEEVMVEMEDGDIKLKNGMVLRIGGDTMEAGVKVKKLGYDGTLSAIADGSYETTNGKVISIVGGDIKGIQSVDAEKKRGGEFTVAESGDVKLESPTFDVGEKIEVIKEDGTKEPAPDGEHQVELKDESGEETKIRVMVKDGMITERENVEEESEDMSGFIEAFAQAMKRLETKIDSISTKQELLDSKFQKFSKEPAGSKVNNNTINQEFSSSNHKLEGWRRLRQSLEK